MRIKNLTNEQQGFKVKELTGEHNVYDMYVQPNSSTDLESVVLLSPEKYKGILEVEGLVKSTIPQKVKETPQPKKSEEVITPVVEEVEESEKVEEVVDDAKKEDNFTCDICGAEFASARGLSTHKNKAHNES